MQTGVRQRASVHGLTFGVNARKAGWAFSIGTSPNKARASELKGFTSDDKQENHQVKKDNRVEEKEQREGGDIKQMLLLCCCQTMAFCEGILLQLFETRVSSRGPGTSPSGEKGGCYEAAVPNEESQRDILSSNSLKTSTSLTISGQFPVTVSWLYQRRSSSGWSPS